MPLRSLHIDAGRTWRGGQRQVLLLAGALRARGGEPLVIGAPHSPLVERAHAAGIATAAAPMRRDWDLRSARRIRAIVRAWNPDIVHAHDARSHAMALLALAGSRTPLVVTRRVTFPPRSVRVKYGPRVSRFIAISHAVARSLTAARVDPGRIDVVYSGVPAARAATPRDWRTELGWPAGSVVAGVVGAMTTEKGIERLHDIAARLAPEAAARTRLVLIGGSARGRLGVGPVEAFQAGFLRDVDAAMAGLDILWHPATAEALGTALLDALALGVPAVAFAVGGIPEILEDGRHGILVHSGDDAAFARAHERLLDSALRRAIGAAGPLRASEFSVERMAESTEQVYRKVLTA